VPHPTDEFDKNTLPDPELNPLLNPLLAAHMGRWAEVYFTNPPERRGQAVADLLRELQSAPPPEADPSLGLSAPIIQAPIIQVPIIEDPIIRDELTGTELEIETAETRDSPSTAIETVRSCSACGYENLEAQRFCGMCGTSLLIAPQSQAHPVVEEPVLAAAGSWNESEPSVGNHFAEYANPPATNSVQDDYIPDTAERLPQEALPHFVVETEDAPYRYRLYVVGAVAILLAVLVYIGWRTRTASSSASTRPALPAAVSAAQPSPAVPTQENINQMVSPEGNSPVPVQSQRQAHASSQPSQRADSQPAAQIVPVAGSSSAVVSEPSTAEDLATAEKYLNGGAAVPRDSSQAAEWLWKAMRQGNVAATMALADLYLRGDGVPQSCDQAHVLLDAAARKGSKAAAERLRHLQAFGCQ
jgi:hypothetical protein